MKTEIYSLPSRWASYFINNDLDDEESASQAKAWMAKNPELISVVECSSSEYFAKTNDAGIDCLAGNCLDFTFLVKENSLTQ